MKLLHIPDQAVHFGKLYDLSDELKDLSLKYKDARVLALSSELRKQVKEELDKYIPYIGKVCFVLPSTVGFNNSKKYREGKINGNFYFNGNTVRCNFKYKTGGYDTYDIAELKESKF